MVCFVDEIPQSRFVQPWRQVHYFSNFYLFICFFSLHNSCEIYFSVNNQYEGEAKTVNVSRTQLSKIQQNLLWLKGSQIEKIMPKYLKFPRAATTHLHMRQYRYWREVWDRVHGISTRVHRWWFFEYIQWMVFQYHVDGWGTKMVDRLWDIGKGRKMIVRKRESITEGLRQKTSQKFGNDLMIMKG